MTRDLHSKLKRAFREGATIPQAAKAAGCGENRAGDWARTNGYRKFGNVTPHADHWLAYMRNEPAEVELLGEEMAARWGWER